MEFVENSVKGFLGLVGQGKVDIYNEISLQHELGLHLRKSCPDGIRIQFERPVSYFGFSGGNFSKKEIDLCLLGPAKKPEFALELKFPRQGQHPEQMFAACGDIAFLEELVPAGFGAGLFLMVVEDELFYRGREQDGIYRFFRAGQPIHGRVVRPTGSRDSWVHVSGSYPVRWHHLPNGMSYWMARVSSLRKV